MNEGKELRPVINKEDPMKEIEKVCKQRENLYNSSADIFINTTNKSLSEIV